MSLVVDGRNRGMQKLAGSEECAAQVPIAKDISRSPRVPCHLLVAGELREPICHHLPASAGKYVQAKTMLYPIHAK